VNPHATPFRSVRALQLFPTLVFQAAVPAPEDLVPPLLGRIRALRGAATGAWQSAPDLHRDPVFAPLVDHVHAAVRTAHHALHYVVEGFRLTGMWANALPAGEHHPVHTHANNYWSGVILLACDDRDARLTFLHPNPAARVLLPTRSELNPANSTSWSVPTEVGVLTLFPSWLEHHVAPVRRGERLSVAFNVVLTGHLLDPGSLQWSDLR
jgi:uncharacterized protein (TIGR02466 family)